MVKYPLTAEFSSSLPELTRWKWMNTALLFPTSWRNQIWLRNFTQGRSVTFVLDCFGNQPSILYFSLPLMSTFLSLLFSFSLLLSLPPSFLLSLLPLFLPPFLPPPSLPPFFPPYLPFSLPPSLPSFLPPSLSFSLLIFVSSFLPLPPLPPSLPSFLSSSLPSYLPPSPSSPSLLTPSLITADNAPSLTSRGPRLAPDLQYIQAWHQFANNVQKYAVLWRHTSVTVSSWCRE